MVDQTDDFQEDFYKGWNLDLKCGFNILATSPVSYAKKGIFCARYSIKTRGPDSELEVCKPILADGIIDCESVIFSLITM